MRPAVQALADQADAAGRDGAAIMVALAERLPAELKWAVPTGPAAAVHTRFLTRCATGRLTSCPHLTGSPQPAWWAAWRPSRVHCHACIEQVSRQVRGTREDRRCDHCRKVRSTIVPGAAQFPALVVDLPGLPPLATGPVTVVYGLCAPCRDASTAAA